jgi:hypothetical protein
VTICWLIFVGSDTAGYLTFIFTRAARAAIQTVGNEAAPRQLFKSSAGSEGPWGERIVALASVLLIASVLPFALRDVWRRFRRHAMAVAFAAAAVCYLVMLFLRFVPKAWEIANRASEFLFLGVAFMLALASVRALEVLPGLRGRILVAAAAVLLVGGGVIAGWPRELRLSLPFRVTVDGRVLQPQGVTAARWSRAELGSGRHFMADGSNARLQLAQGQFAVAGGSPNLNDVIREQQLLPWMVDLLKEYEVRYIVMDRRRIRENQAFGYFFTSPEAERLGLFPRPWYDKFDRQPGASRIFDSGDIAIYDFGRLRYDPDLP